MSRALTILIPLVVAAGAMVTTLCVADFTADGMRVPLWWMGLQGLAAFCFVVAIANLWVARRVCLLESKSWRNIAYDGVPWNEPAQGFKMRVLPSIDPRMLNIELERALNAPSVADRSTGGGAE